MMIVPLTLLDPLASWELCLIAILSAFSVINIIRYLRKKEPLNGLVRDRSPRYVLPDPNPVRPGPGPATRLRDLQRRFHAVSERHDRADDRSNFIIAALAGVIAFEVVWLLISSPWPVIVRRQMI
jgi:hypothetical protein